MISLKELASIILFALILGFSLSFFKPGFSALSLIYYFATIFVIIFISVLSKKIAAFYFDSEIEFSFWKVQRYWFKKGSYFKRPVYVGLILPLIIPLLTFGKLIWMASLVFEIKPKIYRAAKRHGLYSFSETTENHIGYIASAGIIANLFFAILGYLLGYSEFSRLSIFYVLFNIIPISELDGNKIFFGNIVLWYFLATITLIGLFYAFFLI